MTNFLRSRYDDRDSETNMKKKRIAKFSVFVIIAVLVVSIIVGSIFYFNYKNNSLRMFVTASSNVFDCGSFDYEVTASINGTTYMKYDGQMAFDHDNRQIISSYHATYSDYEYDTVIFTNRNQASKGSYYGGKWTIEDYTTTALDFIDFYGDYREYKFNAAAASRFLGDTKTFNSSQLEEAVNDIFKELTKPKNLSAVMNQHIEEKENSTVYTFKPQLDKVADIIVDNIAPAYSSANDFARFKQKITNSKDALKNADAIIMYEIDKNNFLTNASLNYTVNGKTYTIIIKLSNFENAKPQIPEDFFSAVNP